MKRILLTVAPLMLLLSACGSKAAPTIDPVQVQASAISAASTMIAQTKAAIPTATEMPSPSPSPVSSSTPIPLPTVEFPTAAAPTVATQGGQDNCLHPLDMGAAGPKHQTVVKNQSGGTINLSLTLYQPNIFGECGSISYAGVGKNDSITVQLPSGYWYAYAWATNNGKNFTVSGSFYVQPAQSLKLELCVRANNILYQPAC